MRQSGLTCSIVICTRNRPAQLERCLEGLSHLTYPSFEVVVVDNASDDDQARRIAARWGVRYTVEPMRGLSRARNRGVLASIGEIIAFIDDDAVPRSEWLDALVSEFQDPCVIAVTGPTAPLKFDQEGRPIEQFVPEVILRQERTRLDRGNPLWFEIANFGGIGDGNMAFRRKAFHVWSGFDERLGRGVPLYGGEEHYAFSSLVELGYSIVYTPRAVVYHPVPETAKHKREYYLKLFTAVAGYTVFLFLETPHRRRVARYVFETLLAKRRTWRPAGQGVMVRPVSLAIVVMAALRGPWLYLRSRFQSRRRPKMRNYLLRDPAQPQATATAARDAS